METIINICRAEERLQTALNSSNNNLQILSDNLAEAGSFYESSLIQMPVRFILIIIRKHFEVSLDKIIN